MATATKSNSKTQSKTTTKPKSTARKPAAKAKSAAKPTTKTAPRAARTTKTAKTQERTVKNIVVDTAYATVGLTDTAVEVLKSLPGKAAELREEAPVRVKSLSNTFAATLTSEAPKQLNERFQSVTTQGKATVTGLRGQVETQLDSYASRGREVIGKVQNSAATKRALDQSRVARSQVKAAATSVRKAVGASTDAVESAAGKAGTVAS